MDSINSIAKMAMDITARALQIADGYSDRGTLSKLSSFPGYNNIKRAVTKLLDNEWRKDHYACLQKTGQLLDNVALEHAGGLEPYIYAAEVAMWLDRKFSYETDSGQYIDLSSLYSVDSSEYVLINHLNTKDSVQDTQILIFPKYACIPVLGDPVKEKSAPRRTFNRDSLHFLNNTLNNIGYIPINRRQVHIQNIVINKSKFDFETLEIQNGLCIAFAPMVSSSSLPFTITPAMVEDEGEPMKGFQIKGLKKPDEMKRRFEKDILLAAQNNVDLFFGPEMLGSEEMIDRQYGISRNLNRIGSMSLAKTDTSLPYITIFPTI